MTNEQLLLWSLNAKKWQLEQCSNGLGLNPVGSGTTLKERIVTHLKGLPQGDLAVWDPTKLVQPVTPAPPPTPTPRPVPTPTPTPTPPTPPAPMPLVIVNGSLLPEARVDTPYSVQLQAAGGTPPYATWTAQGVPQGLTMATTGILSGTPTHAGQHDFIVTVTDNAGVSSHKQMSIDVAPAQRIPVTGKKPWFLKSGRELKEA